MYLKRYDAMKSFGTMLPFLMAAFIPIAGCSVKEDRNPCPCLLELDIKGPDAEASGSVDVLLTSRNGFVFHETVDSWMEESLYSVSVPRDEIHVRAWCGGGRNVSEDGLKIPLGQDCPRIYMYDSDIVTEGEFYREEVLLMKNHCVLTLVNKGKDNDFTNLVLKGNVSGYDEVGEPLSGDFVFNLGDGSEEEYEAVLPRQRDDSLMLEMEDGKGNQVAFSLGRYIVASGYDWTASELKDVTVTLDYALTEIRLVIDGWESVYRYDVEI